jgi:hypothetical protein
MMETIMSTISGTATERAGAAVAHAVGGAILRWWVAYMTWRIEQWAIGRLRANATR